MQPNRGQQDEPANGDNVRASEREGWEDRGGVFSLLRARLALGLASAAARAVIGGARDVVAKPNVGLLRRGAVQQQLSS